MPKLKNKVAAVKQITKTAIILKECLDNKLGEWNEAVIGRGELREVLGRHGDRLKDVFTLALKKFNVKHFLDPEGEVEIIVEDYDKPLLRIKRLRKWRSNGYR
ncbi:MAG: hypothetical protein NZ929_06515 [Aigarchaeota archaeon]|nr:hypothetical protein [Aigarchaeota archaeon]MCX8192409.1 hypothetical protein [Nitrososphaeria archaeon]MDW7986615.1 hypothetical protein [Nitrososphaerota archaeon]